MLASARIRVGGEPQRRRESRVFYVTTRPEAIHVLHALEKKTQKTSAADLWSARQRLRSLDLEDGGPDLSQMEPAGRVAETGRAISAVA